MVLASSDTVTLRRLSPADLTPFQAYRNDPEVGRYQDWTTMSDDEAHRFLSYLAATDPLMQPGSWTQIAVTETKSGDMIGDLGLFWSKDETEAELGISLARGAQRQGYGTAAFALGLGLLWEQTKAGSIRAWADQRNVASVAMLHKSGMTHLGVETHDVLEEAFVMYRDDAR